jgi:hypothetical protein
MCVHCTRPPPLTALGHGFWLSVSDGTARGWQALTLSGYTRNVSILRNSFTLIGGNTISLMGKTTMPSADPALQGIFGWDGREGDQPRFTTVAGNIASRLGVWEKQSSFYFQSKSCQNTITENIVYGDPRCGINFNDG